MAQIELRVIDAHLGPDDRTELALRLAVELRKFGIEVTEAEGGPSQPGARGIDALQAGVLIVQVAAELGLLRRLIDYVRGWHERSEVGDVDITLGQAHLSARGIDKEQEDRLIEHFISVTARAD